jgi:hypothetical protein
VLFLGFAQMLLGLGVCVGRGIRPDGIISPATLRWGALLVATGAACWTVVVLWA